ncbi:MAG: DUF4250 domain-containing protein [Epulopiscium sp.]|nr:DUF4250 domain-containing protein [Candidatus Epulonipiscium sp.]
MESARLLRMDPYIALSWINMKLRNEYDTLEALCEDLNVSMDEIADKMKNIGYVYGHKNNQFIGIETKE